MKSDSSLLLLSLLVVFGTTVLADVTTGGNRPQHRSRSVGDVLFTFVNDDIEWDPEANAIRDTQGRRPKTPRVTMEVRRVPVPETTMTMRSVFLRKGKLRAGHMVGCYTGELFSEVRPDGRSYSDENRFPYTLWWNDSHLIDPTDSQGEMPDSLPELDQEQGDEEDLQDGGDVFPISKMPYINEPSGGSHPNLVMGKPGWCKDNKGKRSGIPLYAFKGIVPGDELSWCYGEGALGGYPTVCSAEAFNREYYTLAHHLLEVILLPWEATRDRNLPSAKVLKKLLAELDEEMEE